MPNPQEARISFLRATSTTYNSNKPKRSNYDVYEMTVHKSSNHLHCNVGKHMHVTRISSMFSTHLVLWISSRSCLQSFPVLQFLHEFILLCVFSILFRAHTTYVPFPLPHTLLPLHFDCIPVPFPLFSTPQIWLF